LEREEETGVSVIEISERTFDAGAILKQQRLLVGDSTFQELSVELG
jgi:methionyl-tRNA formyltransferase